MSCKKGTNAKKKGCKGSRRKFLGIAILATIPFLTARFAFAAERETTLTVYTFRAPGICPACDATRPIVARLAREYPIDFVYRDDPGSRVLCAESGVDRFPTFIMRSTRPGESPREIMRWSGTQELERRVRSAFRFAALSPRR